MCQSFIFQLIKTYSSAFCNALSHVICFCAVVPIIFTTFSHKMCILPDFPFLIYAFLPYMR